MPLRRSRRTRAFSMAFSPFSASLPWTILPRVVNSTSREPASQVQILSSVGSRTIPQGGSFSLARVSDPLPWFSSSTRKAKVTGSRSRSPANLTKRAMRMTTPDLSSQAPRPHTAWSSTLGWGGRPSRGGTVSTWAARMSRFSSLGFTRRLYHWSSALCLKASIPRPVRKSSR